MASSLSRPRLCLNMIVKNESRIIRRLLESVLPLIDTYCICDTGSSDDTAEIIETVMREAGKPGAVIHEPFRNFGYNRTVALEAAAQWGEYALLLDADMRLHVTAAGVLDTRALREDGYMILQKNGGLQYYNTRIVKLGIGVRCVGVTHEYYAFPPGARKDTKLAGLVIEDIGDGGAKADKFERDIRLLTEGLREEPTNERYMFYLANSYRDSGRPAEAIEWYKRRLAAGGWEEELFYSAYEIGNMYKRLGDTAQAVYWWLAAFERRPSRAESLYEIVKHYREIGSHTLAQHFCDLGRAIPYPARDLLFIKAAVYEYLFDYEQSILAYYTHRPLNHFMIQRLLGTGHMRDTVMGNYRFYARTLRTVAERGHLDVSETVERVVGGRDDTFRSSSPCIVAAPAGAAAEAAAYVMNVRYVNYFIQSNGSYSFRHDDGKITTLNKCLWLDRDLRVLRSHWLDAVEREDLRYQGVEDVKIFPVGPDGALEFLGTVEDPASGGLRLGHGAYDCTESLLRPTAFASPHGRACEKNWAYCRRAGDAASAPPCIVYEWSPLTIAQPRGAGGSEVEIVETHRAVPAFFRDVRGSSNGVRVGDEVWFLCHVVHYSVPRHYYHLIVVLDAANLAYKKHSSLFKFQGDCIEFGLGLVVEDARILVSYSRMDRTSEVLCVDRAVFEREFGWTSV